MTLNLLSALHHNRLGSFESRLQKLKSELLSETPRKWVLVPGSLAYEAREMAHRDRQQAESLCSEGNKGISCET